MEAALAICRFAHFSSAMIAFGASLFVWRFAPVGMRAPLWLSLRPVIYAASFVLALSACLWLALEAAGMTDDWSGAWDLDTLQSVLTDTSFGHLWLVRLVICAALVAILTGRAAPNSAILTGVCALALASLGLAGHSSMQSGALGALHRANDALHLLCGGAWLGGLIPFALCLRACAWPDGRSDAVSAMREYSRVGHVFAPLVVLTGAANVAMTTGALPFPLTTPYRGLLAAKIAVVAVMILVALFNRYYLTPRMSSGTAAWRTLRATSVAQVALALIAVGLVSVFGLLDPA